tara:strand:+ start:94 stop:279 length:186 start_codon:yes stop_codon:yes gene_type:complete
MVFGYNIKEEVNEIGTELKGSRNSMITSFIPAIIAFIGGAILAPRIKKYINKDEEEEDYEQ